MTAEVRNARISNTMLGYEDHGILTFSLGLESGHTHQGSGGYGMGKDGVVLGPRVANVLNALKVRTWEELKGTPVRVYADFSQVYAVGHFIDESWCWFADEEPAIHTELPEVATR